MSDATHADATQASATADAAAVPAITDDDIAAAGRVFAALNAQPTLMANLVTRPGFAPVVQYLRLMRRVKSKGKAAAAQDAGVITAALDDVLASEPGHTSERQRQCGEEAPQ